MAAEYEIKEVGFIGSLWQGQFNQPLNVGRTIEITNVLNTIESGRRQSVFFATKENIDIDKFNRQLPDNRFSFEYGKLDGEFLNELSLYTKIDKNFLSSQTSLFRYHVGSPKEARNSSIPIQENWSFDISNISNVVYIYNTPQSILFTNVVLLVNETYLNDLITYFSELQQEGFTIATPPSEILTIESKTPDDTTILKPFIREVLPLTFPAEKFKDRVILSEEVIENAAIEKFTLDLETFIATQSNAIDFEVFEERPIANELFATDNNEVINSNLKEIDKRISTILQMLDQDRVSPRPLVTIFQMRVQIVYLNMIKNYLYEKLTEINNVGFPDEEPDRYARDTNDNIVILPPPLTPSSEVVSLEQQILGDMDDFDEFIDEIIEDLEVDDNNIYSFKKISKVSDYDLPILRYKTKGLFKCTGEKLSTFHTGSLTEKQRKYYLSVFNEQQYTDESYHQFDITYCHISGSGSSHIEGEVDLYPAKAMYKKYMLECFGHTNGKFPFKNGKNGDYFYAIQLDRTQYNEKLDSGNFEIALCELSSSGTEIHQTSTKFFTLIDESKDTKQEIVTNEGIQEYYYVTSGSLRDGVYNESEDDAWGIVFPKMGLIILDGVVMDQSCSFNTITGSTDGQNSKRLFLSISGAAVPTSYRPSGSFFARSFETHLTETYFCRADFNEFNHSTNYTYVSGSNGFLKYDYFKNRPHSYITTIGLYNRKKELIAVGKLRNPMLKNEGKVCIFEVVVRLN